MVLDGEIFTTISGIFSILAIISYLICYVLVTERVNLEADPNLAKRNNVVQMLKNALTNRALISIICASVAMLTAQLIIQSMSNYVFPNYYGNTTAQSVSMVLMLIGTVIVAAVAKPLAVKIGKAEIGVISGFIATAACVLLFFIRPQNVWVYVAIQGICWMALGVFMLISWAMITDVIDYSEIRNGIREDGAVYALYSFSRKLGQAAAAGLSGGLLTLVGYSEKTAFDRDVLEGIFNISTLVPAVGFLLLSIIMWVWYPLKKKQVEENVEILRKKRG